MSEPSWVTEYLKDVPEEIDAYIYGEDYEVVIPEADTFPKLLLKNAREKGDKTALREKYYGIWKRITWQEYLENVKNIALGLMALGFEEDDKITLIGDNRPEWIYTYLGVESIKGIPFGVYQDNLPEQLLPLINNSDSRWIYCEDQEQTDKVLSIVEDLPEVEKIIVEDWTGMWRYKDNPKLISLEDVMKLGQEMSKKEPGLFEEKVDSTKREDIAAFVTSSGTTGIPKCVMLTYENMLFMGQAMQKVVSMSDRDEYFSFLPLAWMGEQMMVFSCALTVGFRVNFYEEPETVMRDFRELGPTIMFGPPRIWRDMLAEVQVKIADAGKIKQKAFNLAMKIGYECAEKEFKRERIPFQLSLARKLAYYFVFRPILDKLGLKRMRHAFTGGAQVSIDDFRMLRAMGVNIKQIYGQTEIAGISCLHRDGDVDPLTSGKPLPRTVIAITKKGEIISKSPAVMVGYYDRETKDVVNGWLYSGDMGMIDGKGHLVVIDRLADVIRLEDGTLVAPQHLENRLKFSPYVREAMILDDGKPYVTAIINIHFENLAKWAEDHNIPFTGYVDLSQKDEVYDLLEGVVREVNKNLDERMRIRKFLSLYKEFHPDDDEMTRTRKLRRNVIRERYKPIIDALYSDAEEVDFTGEIRYEDGTVDTVRVKMKIRRVE
jgi:long-chain acyl-CoA synthetase